MLLLPVQPRICVNLLRNMERQRQRWNMDRCQVRKQQQIRSNDLIYLSDGLGKADIDDDLLEASASKCREYPVSDCAGRIRIVKACCPRYLEAKAIAKVRSLCGSEVGGCTGLIVIPSEVHIDCAPGTVAKPEVQRQSAFEEPSVWSHDQL